jgi:hypothetical protein
MVATESQDHIRVFLFPESCFQKAADDPLSLLEDIWVPHLHALGLSSLAAVRDRKVYLESNTKCNN